MSTSKLQRYVSKKLSLHFGGYTIRENLRPEWLATPDGARLELDFFIEEFNFAIEVNGRQHYEFVPFFHGDYDAFLKRKDYDGFKKAVCERERVELRFIHDRTELSQVIEELNNITGNDLPPDEYIKLRAQYVTHRTRAINKGLRRYRKMYGKTNIADKKTRKELKKHIEGHMKALGRMQDLARQDFIEIAKMF